MAREIPKSNDQLWKWLERDTGQAVTRVEKRWLEEERVTEVALDSSEPDGYTECVAALRRARKLHKALLVEAAGGRAGPSTSHERVVRLNGVATRSELLRAKVLARWVANRVSRSPVVTAVRAQLLRDPTRDLSPVGVDRLVFSPAASRLPPEFFRDRGIPITGHQAVVIEIHPRITSDFRVEEDVELLIRWRRKELRHRILTGSQQVGTLPTAMRFNFNAGLTVPLELVAYRGSCLWILAEACNELAAAHRWSVTEAAWLILSGLAPDKKPVRTKWRHTWDHTGQPLTALVTVTAKHYVSGRTVARAFERARKMMLLAPAPRPVGERALRLFEFVEDHRDPEQKKIPWSALMREWDRCSRPGWAYQDRGHFMRDYLRARKLLVEEGGSRFIRTPVGEPGPHEYQDY